jgi:predicted component of type VI protein secretion system
MDVVLTITAGPAAVGESRRLRAGQALKVGRGPDVDWPIADPALSARHFAVAADRSDPRAIHLGGGAVTVVDGRPVAQAVLTDASWLVAGHTHFTVSLQDPEQSLLGLRPPADVSPAAAAARFLAELGALHPLYALVDAARDPAILPTVHALDPRCASLLGNGSAHTLDPWAPWLTHVPIDPAPLLEAG